MDNDPRKVGQVWHSHYWNKNYTVLDVCGEWFKLRWEDGELGSNCTAFDPKDKLIRDTDKFVIAPRGNVLIGDYTLIGPFDSIKEAQDWIDEAKRLDQNPYDCIIVQVANPAF